MSGLLLYSSRAEHITLILWGLMSSDVGLTCQGQHRSSCLVWRSRGVWLLLTSLLPARRALESVTQGEDRRRTARLSRTLYTAQTPVHCTERRHPHTVQSTDTRTLYRAQTPVHCTEHRHPYTVQTTDTRTLYRLQTPVHCPLADSTDTRTLSIEYRHPYTVQTLVHCTDTRTLYRHSYTVQTPVHCTDTRTLYRHPYTEHRVQTPVHYADTRTLYRHPYTNR